MNKQRKYGKFDRVPADKLYRARNKKGMTREQLAELLDCTPTAIYNWECAKHKFPAYLAGKLADIFGIDNENFFLDNSISYESKTDMMKLFLSKLKSSFEKADKEADLLLKMVTSLVVLNGYEYNVNSTILGNTITNDDFDDAINHFLTLLKDGKTVLTLSAFDVYAIGQNMKDIFSTNIEWFFKSR